MPNLPDNVEVKYAVAPEDTVRAMERLGLKMEDGDEYVVHFFDRKPVALLNAGVVLRVRQGKRFEGGSDSTCKVRGGRAAEMLATLPDAAKWELEGDQNVGKKAQDSFSITLKPAAADVGLMLEGKVALKDVFAPEGRELLEKLGFAWGDLLAYGPILARKWKPKLPGFEGKVTVEHWKAGDAEVLEISDKKDRDEAAAFAEELMAFMAKDLQIPQLVNEDGTPASKTAFAMKNAASFKLPVGG